MTTTDADGWEVITDDWATFDGSGEKESPLLELPEGDWRRVSISNPRVHIDSNGVVRTDHNGKPYIYVPCPDRLAEGQGQCVGGKIPSEKRPGKLVQCPRCKGKGFKAQLFTRVTSFAGVLDDTRQLEEWRARITVTGFATDAALLAEFQAVDQGRLHDPDPDEVIAVKREMNAIISRAFDVGDVLQAAQKGTDLHKMAELADKGEPLPEVLLGDNGWQHPITLQDRADLAAWMRTVDRLGLQITDIERFVVNDEIQAAGTLDRRGFFHRKPRTGLWCDCGLPKIVDLKTGRVDYGAGKMCQQLSIYSRSQAYDPLTGKRSALHSCPHVGVIIHLPHGTGHAEVHTLDLAEGWGTAIALATQVRAYRNTSKTWIAPVDLDALEEVAA